MSHHTDKPCQRLCPTCNSLILGKVMPNTDAQTHHINAHARNSGERVPCTYIQWDEHQCPIKEARL